MPDLMEPPAPRPCQSCPYRRDVPSGVWDTTEYAKLPAYDYPTGEQPLSLFQCHQTDANSDRARMCAGWAGCHGEELLSLRLAVVTGQISPATYTAATDYQSPVPLFASGAEAAEHGTADIERPAPSALRAIEKITRQRPGLH